MTPNDRHQDLRRELIKLSNDALSLWENLRVIKRKVSKWQDDDCPKAETTFGVC